MKLDILHQPAAQKRHSTPILLVHGLWAGTWAWKENFMPYLSQAGYDVYAVSLRGHENSEGKERLQTTRLGEYVQDVQQAVSSLPEKPILIGHSNGGIVVQKYLQQHTLPAAVLLGTMPISGSLMTFLRGLKNDPALFLKVTFTFNLQHLVGTPERARTAFFSSTLPADKVNRYFGQMNRESFVAFLDTLFVQMDPRKMKTPLLVLGAENDFFFTPAQVQQTAKAYGTTAHIFPNMAHAMMLEDGWQQVADHILKWLDTQPAAR
ncbi:alpha/beta hydrolase [Deinococcus roseus]|uniref:Alpha/beta hydrolase n=1 Tax=Deinococcus roseus TaxID=392414 RepID=A0ABQ2CWD8_9DEIO|nr:alpha/beta hydrolase [Deinococcus roseus]GGJ27249.1 alpha/beta hydrolase [Deinococcus roseus]